MARFPLLLIALLFPAAAAAGDREVVLRLGAESDSNPTRVFGEGEGLEAGPKGTISYREQWLAWRDGLFSTESQVGARWLPARNDWAAVWQLGGGLTWMADPHWSHQAQAEFRGRSEAMAEDDRGIARDYERLSATVGSRRAWEAITLDASVGYAAFGYVADHTKSWHGPTLMVAAAYAPTEAVMLSATYEPSLRLNASADFSATDSLTQSTTVQASYDAGRWLASVSGGATVAASSLTEPGSGDYLHESVECTVGALLWGDAVGRLSAVLQRVNYDGVGSAVDLSVEDDDRSQVRVAFEQPLGGHWGVEARYQRLFQRRGSEFEVKSDFERHIAFVGLSWRSGGESSEP